MTFKLIVVPETERLHAHSYECQLKLDCLDKFVLAEDQKKKHLSKPKFLKACEDLASKYVIFYFVESYSYPVNNYHDADGDYTHSDSETNTYPTPKEEMVAALAEMGYTNATQLVDKAIVTDHYNNLYYGESINLCSYAIKI